MSGITFRPLEASDVEVRVAQVNEKGCSLLLYKDARCDMRLLDDAVGAENWECEYRQIGGTLYCRVGIYSEDRGETVWKEDCGTESNMEAKKGEASDAFKRACFKWGIGRELYTAPFVWVAAGNCDVKKGKNGRLACYDRFEVAELGVEDGAIRALKIANRTTGKVVYELGKRVADPPRKPQERPAKAEDEGLRAAKARLWAACKEYAEFHGKEPEDVSNEVKNRSDYEESVEFFEAVAREFEDALESECHG